MLNAQGQILRVFSSVFEPPSYIFNVAIFNFHGDFGQKVGNYHVTILDPQTNAIFKNIATDPGVSVKSDLDMCCCSFIMNYSKTELENKSKTV
jgi:hypothetical protein